MIAQILGAIARAFLVVVLIATPSLLLPAVSSDAAQIVALVAICAGALTLFEYTSTYPGLVEFRDAPPFNRIRFGAMFATVFLLTIIYRGEAQPSAMTQFMQAVSVLTGQVLDFPYSPVRLFVLILPDSVDPAQVVRVRSAAGLAYLVSLLSIGAFMLVIRFNHWPLRQGNFNFWVNLPTFDPTTGADVVARLTRVAWINTALGFLIPFLFPAVMTVAALFSEPMTLENPQTLIWTVSAWALLPSSLIMRGIALQRIVNLIEIQRRRAAPDEDSGMQLA
ncbi:hypothetical protein [Actibacterium sp. D379-3]